MAGLCAAARARELGGSPMVLEKGSRPGGSMLLSSGVIWRYRSFDEFRAQCPGGDPRLQELVHGRLDESLEWLEALGAPVLDAGDRQPADDGCPLRSGRPDRSARPRRRRCPLRPTGDSHSDSHRSAACAGDRRISGRPRARRAVRAARRAVAVAGQPLECRGRATARARAGRGAHRRPGRVLRAQHGRRRLRRARVRVGRAGLRPLRAHLQRPRRGVRRPQRGHVVGDRPGAGDRPPAGRASLVFARRRGARRACPRALGSRDRLRGAHAHRARPTSPSPHPNARLSRFASPPRSRTRSEACASTSGRACWTARALR